MAIQVNLEDSTGNVSHVAKMDANAEVAQLIPAIISSLRLPITDNQGHPITYHLRHRNRRLQESETLASAEVQAGETLAIVPEMVAGEIGTESANIGAIRDLFSTFLKENKIKLGGSIDSSYIKAISSSVSTDKVEDVCSAPDDIPLGFELEPLLRAHKRAVTNLAWSPVGNMLASSARDGTICLWDLTTKRLLRTLIGHAKSSTSITWSPSGEILASGSADQSIRLWKTNTGEYLNTFMESQGVGTARSPMRVGLDLRSTTTASQLLNEPDEDVPVNVVWSPDSNLLAVATEENIALWDTASKKRLQILKGHTSIVNSIAWSPDGKKLVSASSDQSMIVWDVQTFQQRQTFTGHTGDVNYVVWSPYGTMLASCSNDYTIRIWNPEDGQQMRILEGHTDMVICASFSYDERVLASQDADGTILLWRTDTWQQVAVLKGSPSGSWMTRLAFHPGASLLAVICKQVIQLWNLDLNVLANITPSASDLTIATMQYTSAKIVLVGNSAVGKSGLSLVLTGRPYAPMDSTVSCELSTFDTTTIQLDETRQEQRETFLWDLAGQPVYRLIHQLRLNTTILAMVVFDGQSDTDPFAGVHYWDRALRRAQSVQGDSALPLKKFLVAGRIDSSGIGVSEKRIERLCSDLKFDQFFRTSAKTGDQIEELRNAIRQNIDWNSLPKVSSTLLFQQVRQFLKEQRKIGQVLLRIDHLSDKFLQTYAVSQPLDEQYKKDFKACIDSAESQDLILKLGFGDLVLLQPELRDAYAFSLINSVRDQPDGFGCIAEEKVLKAEFPINKKWRLSDKKDEELLLIAMIKELVQYEIVLREHTDEGPQLIFPSQCTDEFPDMPHPGGKTIVIRFEGPIANICAALVVRLSCSSWFKKDGLWKDTATYKTLTGEKCGIFLENKGEGRAVLTLFFDEKASDETRCHFEKYVLSYLEKQAIKSSVRREYIYTCSNCNEELPASVVQKRLARGLDWVFCPNCTEDGETVRISLLDGKSGLTVSVEPAETIKSIDEEAKKQKEQQKLEIILKGKIATGAFDVFLCHNSIDKPQVKEIGEQLKKLGILPWLDEWDVPPGTPWQPFLEKQIKRIKSVAVFVGENDVGPWQEFEIRAFLSEFVRRECPVIPVILPDVSASGTLPSLPLFLKEITWVDFRKKEPNPFRQLIWGITGKKG